MVSFFRKITVSLLTFSMLLLSFPAWAQVNFTKLEITAYDLENFSEGKAAFSQITGDPIYTALSPDGAVSFLYGYLDEKAKSLSRQNIYMPQISKQALPLSPRKSAKIKTAGNIFLTLSISLMPKESQYLQL